MDTICQASSMQFSQESIVALAAIGGNVLLTWRTLRAQRRSMHLDLVWQRRTAAYDDCVAMLGVMQNAMREGFETESSGLAPPPPRPAEHLTVLSRLEMYASEPVREAAEDWEEADRDWRKSYDKWKSHQDAAGPEAEAAANELKARAKRDRFRAGVLAGAVVDTIRRDVLTARPRRLYTRYRMEQSLAMVDKSKGKTDVYVQPIWLPGWAERLRRLLWSSDEKA